VRNIQLPFVRNIQLSFVRNIQLSFVRKQKCVIEVNICYFHIFIGIQMYF
jgi:hypothetical protein